MIGILQWYFSLKETGLLLNTSRTLEASEQVERIRGWKIAKKHYQEKGRFKLT